MFQYIKIFVVFFLLFFVKPAFAQDQINLYLFYGDGCPHCEKEIKFLDKLQDEDENISVKKYEVWHDSENAELLEKVGDRLNLKISGVPVLIIGDKSVTGFYNEVTTGKKIREAIEYYKNNKCEDVIASLIGEVGDSGKCIHGCNIGDSECVHDCGCSADSAKEGKLPETIDVPLFGRLEVKNISLPALTVLIAALDGFNPCAMWVLLFLISLLLGMQDRKKMWILGSAFILSSGVVYFLFLSAWLNLFLFLGFIAWIRIIIAIVALFSGIVHLKSWWKNKKGGCVAAGGEKRKAIFDKIRHTIQNEKFYLALSGIILLAAAINMVELVCSAGLPAVYTQILSMSDLSKWEYYAYLIFYIIIFTLDDLLVFIAAMATLQMKGISLRYTRWSNLVGGIIMVAIGILLIFKPGWLMF